MAGSFPEKYDDPVYAAADAQTEQKLGLPVGLLSNVRTNGERSNHSQTNSLGTFSSYQFIPSTRKAILDKYGIDVTLSPQNASEGAGLLLKEGLDRNKGDPTQAVGEYIGGLDRGNWGKQTNAYINRVMVGHTAAKTDALADGFAKFMAANPATPPAKAAEAAPTEDKLSAGFGQWLQTQAPKPGAEAIPVEPGANTKPTAVPEPSLGDKIIGTGEAGLTALTGATGGTLGMIGGTLGGMADSILSGKFGTPEAAKLVEQSAAKGAQALTYEPRTPQGQEQAAAMGEALQNVIPIAAIAPGLIPASSGAKGAPAGVVARAGAEGTARAIGGEAAAAGVSKAIDATTRAAEKATTLPRRAMDALRGTPSEPAPASGMRASVEAAGVPAEVQRQALAESFPAPIELTKGQVTRDPAQLKFEVETAKNPEVGAPLRQRYVQQNEAILRNFDTWADQTGAEAPSLRATGQAVDKALVDQMRRDKTRVNAAYAEAKRSPEAAAIVDQTKPVLIGEGDSAITNTPMGYLNEQPTGLPSTALTDAARQYAVRLGIADMQDGQLVPRPATIRQLEDWRKAINQATGYEPADIRHATILKAMIDSQTEPVAGPLYRQARATRTRFAQNYEDRAVISKLLSNKRGTMDRAVALEDTFDHAILKGSLDDVRNVRRVLQRSGPDGQQAWKELQGSTVSWIRDQATKGIATDASGTRVLSPAALDKAIRSLDTDGRLDFIFGKNGAQQIRDINELAQIAKTVPPEAAINMSNTASTMLSAFGDIGLAGVTGVPAPIATAGRIALKSIKDRALRKRIAEALNRTGKK